MRSGIRLRIWEQSCLNVNRHAASSHSLNPISALVKMTQWCLPVRREQSFAPASR